MCIAAAALMAIGARQVGIVLVLASIAPLVLIAAVPGRRRRHVVRECARVIDDVILREARTCARDIEVWLSSKR
jgi:hypothetical protein